MKRSIYNYSDDERNNTIVSVINDNGIHCAYLSNEPFSCATLPVIFSCTVAEALEQRERVFYDTIRGHSFRTTLGNLLDETLFD